LPSFPVIIGGIVKKKLVVWVLAASTLLSVSPVTSSQKPKRALATSNTQHGNTDAITAAQLKNYLDFVASDEMEGRDTPSRGLDTTLSSSP
jgi:hypothetical protein